MAFASIPEALELFREGEMLIIVDDEDRENEGDLAVAADKITPEIINFMATHGRGLICLALAPEICDRLDLKLMSPENTSNFGTNFTESIDALDGISTGISSFDRAHTIRVAMSREAMPQDLARPGHMFPLRSKEGGVLVRAGQTEAVVDLARIAGLGQGGVICEIMNPDGSMSRLPELKEFALTHNLKIISVADLIRHRLRHERFIQRIAESSVTNEFGTFRAVSYLSAVDQRAHLALVYGDKFQEPDLVRVQRLDGDVFHAVALNNTVRGSLAEIVSNGSGAIVFLQLTGQPQNGPLLHEAGIGAQILADLGLHRVRLLTNHPRKIVGLEGYGIEVVAQSRIQDGKGNFQAQTLSQTPIGS